jgi:acyl-CoA dehydrogenase family protein 9
MPKCGIRGTATARLAFRDMPVPAENVLGQMGKGLRLALTVLDFGRTTFGASCTGTAKACIEASVRHANARVQFKEPIGEFELTKKKIANMAAHAFAMDAMTTECAGFIDRGAEDYMLETAMLKVFATDHLWTIVNDTLQIYGGQGYFTRDPYERWMRDARINTIGEGANEVLKAFIAVVGMRGVGEALRGVLSAMKNPLKEFSTLWAFSRSQLGARFTTPTVPVQSPALTGAAASLSGLVRDFGVVIPKVLAHIRTKALARGAYADEEIAILETLLKSQYIHERLANAACDLYASACSLARLDSMLVGGNGTAAASRDVEAGRHFLAIAERRVRANLAELWDNLDDETTRVADLYLKGDAT